MGKVFLVRIIQLKDIKVDKICVEQRIFLAAHNFLILFLYGRSHNIEYGR